MNGFPPLVPDYPKKQLRLTLDPIQAVGLWHLLDKTIDAMDDLDKSDQEKFGLLVYQSIESMLSDRLTFRAKGAVQ